MSDNEDVMVPVVEVVPVVEIKDCKTEFLAALDTMRFPPVRECRQISFAGGGSHVEFNFVFDSRTPDEFGNVVYKRRVTFMPNHELADKGLGDWLYETVGKLGNQLDAEFDVKMKAEVDREVSEGLPPAEVPSEVLMASTVNVKVNGPDAEPELTPEQKAVNEAFAAGGFEDKDILGKVED